MKENPFHIIPKILAAAAGFLAVVMVFAFAFEAFAFVGPSQAPTNGSGAIGSDASNNVSVGTPTTIPGTKLVVIGASSDNTTNAAQFLENNNTPIFILRDDGSISIATTTITAGTTIIGGNLTIGGTVTAPNLSSFIGANLVTSGEFGDGNGNYTFGGTSNVYFPGSGIWNSSGNVGIGTTAPNTNLVIGTNASAGAMQFEINNTYTGGTSWYLGSTDNGNAIGGGDFVINNSVSPTGSKFIINSSGYVGIGTTNPGYALDVNGTARATTLIDSGLTSQNCIGTNSSGQLQGGTCGATGALTGSGTANVMAMFTGAGVIGNSSPVITESGTSGGTVSIAGNVGIGTTNPSVKLDVAGGINLEANGSNDAPLQVGYTSASPAGYYATYAP